MKFVIFLLSLVAGLAQQLEHILLVHLNTGLVEGVDAQHVCGNAAAQLQEVEHFAHLLIVQSAHVHGNYRHATVAVTLSGSDETGYSICIISRTADAKALGTAATAALGGRGGGKREAFQGNIPAKRQEIVRFFEVKK